MRKIKNPVKVGFFSFYALILAKKHEKSGFLRPPYARERFFLSVIARLLQCKTLSHLLFARRRLFRCRLLQV